MKDSKKPAPPDRAESDEAANQGEDWSTRLSDELDAVVESLGSFVEQHRSDVHAVHPVHHDDAVNLLHYLALRRRDVRSLQRSLARYGLSSLGRSEPHVLATVRAVRSALRGLVLQQAAEAETEIAPGPHGGPDFLSGRRALDVNTDALFGPRPSGRVPRIMVTLPTEASGDRGPVQRFAENGMDVARINGAYDGPDEWIAMARNVSRVSQSVGRHIAIAFDLPGPKLRTGRITDGPRVIRVRPRRDARGVPIVAARIVLAPVAGETVERAEPGERGETGERAEPSERGETGERGETADRAEPGAPGEPVLPVDAAWLSRCRPGDQLHLLDTRASPRTIVVVSNDGTRVTGEVWDTTYFETGTVIRQESGSAATVGVLPPVEQAHRLRTGDRLHVLSCDAVVDPWFPGAAGEAQISCTLGSALAAVKPGERIVFDDGKLNGVVESASPEEIVVRILWAPPGGARLRGGKGVNLPDTHLPLPMLDRADRALIDIAAEHGDMLCLSFLRHEDDVDEVLDALAAVSDDRLGLVLKIETIPGFQRLPEILLRAMKRARVGVMIARGDLAVETSYERLAEIQEEILWLCEAAHVPVIWATAVLENLVHTGMPSRAEITDAAMAQRAECIMLNKGPYVAEAITVLDDILRRMAGHQRKKTALLRPLHAWDPVD